MLRLALTVCVDHVRILFDHQFSRSLNQSVGYEDG